MAVEGVGGQIDPTINVFWLALAFIIVGSGFLKANISVMVGQLYRLTDIRRDGAYTIFYMGINLGAAIGTILVGYLGETIGWGYGFGARRHRHARRPGRVRARQEGAARRRRSAARRWPRARSGRSTASASPRSR